MTKNANDRLTEARIAAGLFANRAANPLMAAMPEAVKRMMARAVTIDGNTLDATLQLALAGLKLTGETNLTARDDVAYSRERIRRLALMIDRSPVPVSEVVELTLPGPAGDIAARHYVPVGDLNFDDDTGPLLMYLHGGGWVIGDLDTHDNLCRTLCRDVGIHVLSVAYRLAPEHPAPAGLEDAYAAYRWALRNAGELGAQPGVVAVGGDSAGGNLAAVISRWARDDGVPAAMQVLLYPAMDQRSTTRSRVLFERGFFLTGHDMDWCGRHYARNSALEATDPLLSPGLATDLAGLPPALVVTAGFDPLRDEGEDYAMALREAGVLVDLRRMSSLTHAFCNFAPIGGGSAVAMAEIASALRAHLRYV
ncbi:MAG: acetyl esterase [Mycobacterium sp.]|nr:acetyl esterase [Mycobacterium sp.]